MPRLELPHPADALPPGVQWRYDEDTEEIVAYEQRADGRWPEEEHWGNPYGDGHFDSDDGRDIVEREYAPDSPDEILPGLMGDLRGPIPTAAEWEAAMARDPELRMWNDMIGQEMKEEERRDARANRLQDSECSYSGSDVDEVDEERRQRRREEEEEEQEQERERQRQRERERERRRELVNSQDNDEDEDDMAESDEGEEGDDEMRGPDDEDDEDDDDAVDNDGGTNNVNVDNDIDVDDEVDGEDGEDDADDAAISFDPMLLGLKEINNLAHFSVSSHKPGNGVEELLNDDLGKYWQSDGPQPHLLTIHFLRRVEIRAIRFYVDHNQDESYTPTCVVLSAGTGHHDLLEFASLVLTNPVGWQEIDLSGVGGGADGQSLCCWIVQLKVKENHQNGKDTHIRGIKLYAIDENAPPADGALDELARIKTRTLQLQTRMSREAVAADKDDYLFERLIAQSPDKLPGAPERSGSMAKFLRDEEIR